MELTLIVRSGDDAGRRIAVPADGPVRVGRSPPADARFPADPMLSAVHFLVECGADGPVVRDLGSRFGTLLNGVKVAAAGLRDGDEIRAGRTAFAVAVLGPPTAAPPEATAAADPAVTPLPPALAEPAGRPLAPDRAAVLAHLRRLPGPLFALLDAAREPSVVGRLERSGQAFQCLYDGDRGDELSPFGPWLVSLPAGAAVLEELVRDGWGNSWGVYLTCRRSLGEVRRHLRQFLKAKLPDGRVVLFRFYDPRVLRTYLPTCTADEVASFLGPIERVVAEGPDPGEVLEFAPAYRDWRKVQMAEPAGAG